MKRPGGVHLKGSEGAFELLRGYMIVSKLRVQKHIPEHLRGSKFINDGPACFCSQRRCLSCRRGAGYAFTGPVASPGE